ncbi:MAG: leucine-rich repeat domain-containing protein [Acetatifactor muris]|nr:leucine-rich repeat domain-containing protein [Acetatifactor muris]
MGKKAGKWKQAAALLLAVSCVICGVPDVRFTYAKDGVGITETAEDMPEITETETEAAEAEAGETEGTEAGAGETEDTESTDAEKAGTEESTKTENTEATEDTENDTGTGEPESGTNPGGQDAEADKEVSGEMEITAGEPETESEDFEMESVALLSDVPAAHDGTAEGDSAAVDADYTDSSGVTYSYYGYADGTAAVHTVTDYAGKDVNIPSEIDGYTVTAVNASFPFGAKLASLTIPEPVTYIGEHLFWGVEIGVLYFNAAEAVTSDNNFMSPFSSAKIGAFYTGGNVCTISKWMFNMAEFTGSVALTVADVETDAFVHAEFGELTLTDAVGTLHAGAFQQAHIQTLHYNTHAVHTAGGVTESAFYQARIYALDFGADVTELPGYAFSGAYFYFNEFTCDLERVGDYAFYSAWPTYDPYYVELTVTENVKYLGAAAFSYCDIRALAMDAELETGAKDSQTGCFYAAKIGSLAIGENVAQIPDYLFCNAYVTQTMLNLDMERIGKYAFYDRSTITELTIGENVKDIGIGAFASAKITSLHYNAVNATVGGNRSDERK